MAAEEVLFSEKIFFLLLGWALGLLGPAIVEAIRKWRDNAKVKKALRNELGELRYRLAGVVHLLRIRLGTMDKELLEWVTQIVRNYDGVNAKKDLPEILARLSSLSDAQLAALAQADALQGDAALVLRKYSAPLLEEKLDQLSSFKVELQAQLLEARASLAMFNDEVDQSQFYFRLTFTNGIGDANYQRAVENLKGCYKDASARAKILADLIGRVAW